MPRPRRTASPPKDTQAYRHPDADLPVCPEIGSQAQFMQARQPINRFDSALAPELNWDVQDSAGETAEHLTAQLWDLGPRASDVAAQPAYLRRDHEVAQIKTQITETHRRLRSFSGPFLNRSGKTERLSLDVSTLPLCVHERMSASAVLATHARPVFLPRTGLWKKLEETR